MMIDRLYSEFDSEITIRPKEGKTFNENQITAKGVLSFVKYNWSNLVDLDIGICSFMQEAT